MHPLLALHPLTLAAEPLSLVGYVFALIAFVAFWIWGSVQGERRRLQDLDSLNDINASTDFTDPRFRRFCDGVASEGGLTRARHGEGWKVESLERRLPDGALLTLQLRYDRQGAHRLTASVVGVASDAIHLQSLIAYGRDTRRGLKRQVAVDIATGDAPFDDAFALRSDHPEALAVLTAPARAALCLLDATADVLVARGTLTATRALRSDESPADVVRFTDAALSCAQALHTPDDLDAAWVAIIQGDPLAARRLLRSLAFLPPLSPTESPLSDTIRSTCRALCQDPSTPAPVRFEAAKCLGSQGFKTLAALTQDANLPADDRVEAFAILSKHIKPTKRAPLLLSLLSSPNTPQRLLCATYDALAKYPTPGAFPFLAATLTASPKDPNNDRLLRALGSAPEPDADVEAALLPILAHIRPWGAALHLLARRGALPSVLALKRQLADDLFVDEDRAQVLDAIEVIQARLSDATHAGALSLLDPGEAGALSLPDPKP